MSVPFVISLALHLGLAAWGIFTLRAPPERNFEFAFVSVLDPKANENLSVAGSNVKLRKKRGEIASKFKSPVPTPAPVRGESLSRALTLESLVSWGNSPPAYPALALRKKWQGEVTFRLIFSEAGTISRIEVLKSSGHEILDRAAVDAARDWKIPVEIAAAERDSRDVTVRFKMDAEGE